MDRNIRPYIPDLGGSNPALVLDLYVANQAQGDAICTAIHTVTRQYGVRACNLKVINVYNDPASARAQKIQTVPTIVRRSPQPERKIIGKLDDTKYLRMALGVEAAAA